MGFKRSIKIVSYFHNWRLLFPTEAKPSLTAISLDNDLEKNLPLLFLFLDPTRTGEYSNDPFVLSTSKRQYQFGETRPTVCRLNPKWRQSSITEEGKSARCHILCAWVKMQGVKLQVCFV